MRKGAPAIRDYYGLLFAGVPGTRIALRDTSARLYGDKGYPFSSTDHWMLWSGVVGRDALIGYRLGGHSLLQQPIEQQSARA